MRRISVIGASGSGKSTMSRAMAANLGLPVIHLDREFWQPGWVEPDTAAWRAHVAELVSREAWVMDGDYGSLWDLRMPRTEAIVWLDRPRRIYFPRAVWRSIKGFGRTRPDMADGCPEQIDRPFLFDWLWNYPTRSRASTAARLAALGSEKRVVILRTKREVAAFVAGLPATLFP